MRLFDSVGLYVTLIVETVYDLRYFMIMFSMIIMTFGNAVYTLNQIPAVYDGLGFPHGLE